MSETSRELVYKTINFENPGRAPRELWALPIATDAYPEEIKKLHREFPMDFCYINPHLKEKTITKGNVYDIGEYIDEWGCKFTNIQKGIIGEVKDPIVKNWDEDVKKIHIPKELLSINRDLINKDCAATDKFTNGGNLARPFEQLQFIRGTADLYMDFMDPPKQMLDFMKEMHNFYTGLFTLWCKTDVDYVSFMDDWGSQISLLMSPKLWRRYFKPMYADYIEIAHKAGKRIFMHSDGNILSIIPDLVELELDMLNAQIFCIEVEKLKPYAGKTTFFGEIDRQHLLPKGTTKDIDNAVKKVYNNLWKNGGCVAQCEFSPGAKPENVFQVYKSWQEVVK